MFDTFSSLHQKLPTSQLTGRLLRCTSCLHTLSGSSSISLTCPVFSFFRYSSHSSFLLAFLAIICFFFFFSFLLPFFFSFFIFFVFPRCCAGVVSFEVIHALHTYLHILRPVQANQIFTEEDHSQKTGLTSQLCHAQPRGRNRSDPYGRQASTPS